MVGVRTLISVWSDWGVSRILIWFCVGCIGLLLIGCCFPASPRPETCIYDAVFQRTECCVNVVQTAHGVACAVGQPVRIYND